MYLIQVDHMIYDADKRRGPFTLTAALAAVRGVGNARVLRGDGTVAVDKAGSDYRRTHVRRPR